MGKIPFDSSNQEHSNQHDALKRFRLGRLNRAPLNSVTLAVHGLNPKDAVELTDQKIRRARLAGAEQIRILFSSEEGKVKKALIQFLIQCDAVEEFDAQMERDDEISARLSPLAG